MILKVFPAGARWAFGQWQRRRQRQHQRSAPLVEQAMEELAALGRRDDLVARVVAATAKKADGSLVWRMDELPSHEEEAAWLAVGDALAAAELSDDVLFAANADAEGLARQVRARSSGVVARAALSGTAEQLYELGLDLCCRYLAEVVHFLPAFPGRAERELLKRSSAQSDQLGELTSRLDPTGRYGDFERRYRQHLSKTLDRLELLGLPMEDPPRLSLDLAYLSLSVAEEDDARNGPSEKAARQRFRRPGHQWYGLGPREQARAGPVPVETAIGESPRRLARAFVHGEAGSGKTTLLTWLAVMAARQEFPEQLGDWNQCVPFRIRLRHYVDGQLPTPDEFLRYVADVLVGRMPAGWVHHCLESGSALLLIDGVDEVPVPKRPAVREWLEGLLAEYPEMRVVVTTRPTAVDQRWLADSEFTPMTLEPMSHANIREFVRRWHLAARNAPSLAARLDQLPAAERRLLAWLDGNPRLAVLATSPLLCALLCALNLDSASELPRNRMDLYRDALDLLLGRRDYQRDVRDSLPAGDKEALLRDLAWRLVLAGSNQFDRGVVLRHVTERLSSMPAVREPADQVLKTLLERSGMLRRAAPDRLEFVHSTFAEYLAAAAAIAGDHVQTLVDQAHLDPWRGVVVMACGLARPDQRRALIRGILDRVTGLDPQHRKLAALVGSCLETIGDLDRALDTRTRVGVDTVVHTYLTRPGTRAEAGALSTIGEPLLRYLPGDLSGRSREEAVAVVFAAALTGSDEALPLLARYAADPRKEVQNELVRCWQYFDPERYAREVLADAPLNNGAVRVRLRRTLPYVRLLRHATEVRVRLTEAEPVTELGFLAGVPNVIEIFAWCTGKVDLAPVAAHPRLDAVRLYGGAGFGGLDVLARLRALTRLSLQPYDAGSLTDLDFVRPLAGLRTLMLAQAQRIADFGPLRGLGGALETLVLTESAALTDVEPIRHLSGLVRLTLNGTGIHDLAGFAAFSRLERLYLERTPVRDLRSLDAPRLRSLGIRGCPVTDLGPLAGRHLTLYLSPDRGYQGLDRLGPDVEVSYA